MVEIIKYPFFEKELSYIKNKEIRTNTEILVKSIYPQFFAEAASSTGKYHPDYALGFGGLYRHTCAAVKIANELLQLDIYKNEFSDTLKDYIIAALILHDSCKRGMNFEFENTKFDHPLIAAEFVEKVLGDCEYTRSVSNLVKTHMGQFNTSKYDKTVLPLPELAPQKFVFMCDYLASRKWLDVKLNIDD